MSTSDVPGANPSNADKLGSGCWAEHSDGSLLFVLSTEDKRVVAELFDMAETPIIAYKFASPRSDFEKRFSYPPVGTSPDRWTWHDKTPFPWDRIIKVGHRPRPQIADATEQITAAKRVAKSLNARARQIRSQDIAHRTEQVTERRTRGIFERIGRAIAELRG